MSMKKRIGDVTVLFLALSAVAFCYVCAIQRIFADPPEMTAREIDGASPRDLEMEAMQARIDDLEADLAAREEELEDLANLLNGAIADRTEAIAMLREAGALPCVWWQEFGGVPTEQTEDTEGEP